jgi:RHS repeat-associated protein
MLEQVQQNSNLAASAIADQPPLASAGPTGNRQATFGASTHLAAALVALKPPPSVLYYHQDRLGSTRALTNQAGTVVATATYDPYGRPAGSSQTAQLTNPFGYAGEYSDAESGLVYLRARYYEPATGQFLSRDPAVALTQSAYGYVGDNPLNGTDDAGLCAQLISFNRALQPCSTFSDASIYGEWKFAEKRNRKGITFLWGFQPSSGVRALPGLVRWTIDIYINGQHIVHGGRTASPSYVMKGSIASDRRRTYKLPDGTRKQLQAGDVISLQWKYEYLDFNTGEMTVNRGTEACWVDTLGL